MECKLKSFWVESTNVHPLGTLRAEVSVHWWYFASMSQNIQKNENNRNIGSTSAARGFWLNALNKWRNLPRLPIKDLLFLPLKSMNVIPGKTVWNIFSWRANRKDGLALNTTWYHLNQNPIRNGKNYWRGYDNEEYGLWLNGKNFSEKSFPFETFSCREFFRQLPKNNPRT